MAMWLTDLRIVLPDGVLERGAIRIDGEVIAAIREGEAPAGARGALVDGRGLLAIPGMIDMHGDMLEIEAEPRPGAHFPLDLALHELDKRLAGNGITTAYAAVSFWETVRRERARTTDRAVQLVETIHRLRPGLLVDHFIHARYEVTTPSVAPALADLLAGRRIHLLSLMDHTPGQGQYRDLEQYVAAISQWRGVDPRALEAETRAKMAQGAPGYWPAARAIVQQAAALGVPLASHDDDTALKVELMAGFGVRLSEFPVTLEAARAARRHGMAVVMGAPNAMRGHSHTGNLSALEAVAAGAVDLLASDYAPAAMLQALFVIVERELLPLHAAVRLVAQHAAAALGLHDRGRLAPGLLADIALVEPDVRPRVRGTLRRGLPIYWDGAMARRTTYR
jgi:alpha-D-ribose 1-methylphosphonate 5-triphosphate diphosphatase